MSDTFTNERLSVEREDEWRKWVKEIPFLKFPRSWSIQVIPPFAGAVARFRVERGGSGVVSVYLDCYSRLGCYDGPYWEVYPFNDDVGRCDMADTKTLMSMISRGLRESAHD